jgi:hypothetical protein
VFFLCIYLIYRLIKCSRRRFRPQDHSRRHSHSFSHTIYQTQNNDGRRVSNYSFPLPSRLPTYQQATHLRSPSRTRSMQSVGSGWPLNQQNPYLARHQQARDDKPPSPTSLTGSATSSTPSQISVASTLVPVPLPAHVDLMASRQSSRPYVVSPISMEDTSRQPNRLESHREADGS